MTRFSFVFLLIAAALVLQACDGPSGADADGRGGETREMKTAREECARPLPGSYMRYAMAENENGRACTTGCQTYYSLGSYCSGLQNESLNNGCARAGRQAAYERACRQ